MGTGKNRNPARSSFEGVCPNTRRLSGSEFATTGVELVTGLREVVKPMLGPSRLSKLLVRGNGSFSVTSDCATMLSEIASPHPVTGIVIDAAKALANETGDGATSTILISCELVRRGSELRHMGIHPTLITESFAKAQLKAIEILNEIAFSIDLRNHDHLKRIAFTAISSKWDSPHEQNVLADIAVRATTAISSPPDFDPDLSNISIRKGVCDCQGPQLVDGFAFRNEVAHPQMPRSVDEARIALLTDGIVRKKAGKARITYRFQIDSPTRLREFVEQEEKMLLARAQRVLDAGANAIMIEKGLDPVAAQYFASRGILVVRRIVIEDLERIARATGGRIVSEIADISSQDLGSAKLVQQRRMGPQEWIFVEGCASPRSVAVLLNGVLASTLQDVERKLKKSMLVTSSAIRDPRAVVGAGATEMEVALRLRDYSPRFRGKEQLGLICFADCIESIPATLAENSGLNPIEAIAKLRAYHRAGELSKGIDGRKGLFDDMFAAGLWEPLTVKEQILKSASEAAISVLRIDDFIAARRLAGAEEREKRLKDAQEPEYKRSIRRQYGLESLETEATS